jgi:hypothetical protein
MVKKDSLFKETLIIGALGAFVAIMACYLLAGGKQIPELIGPREVLETEVVYEVVTNTPEPPETPEAPSQADLWAPATWLTLDGYEDGVLAVETINIWVDHYDRDAGVAATGKHGERVKLIERVGDGVKIETEAGDQGWVIYTFVKEYK